MKKNKVRSFYVGNLYKGLKKKFTIKEEPDQGYLEALRYQASVEQYRFNGQP